jgi:hypothetical protein
MTTGLERERLLLAAEVFLSWDWIPIPLLGKVPLGQRWQETEADLALETIQRFTYKFDNLGVLTGPASDIVVVDVDIKEKGLETWRQLIVENGEPETLTVETGTGGLHVYFKYNPGLAPILNQTGYGIEFKTTGGMVVAPWSLHPNTGRPYTPLNYGPESYGLPKLDQLELLMKKPPILEDMPDWLFAYFRARRGGEEEEEPSEED